MFKISSIMVVIATLLLAGCSNISRFDVPGYKNGTPNVESIIGRIRCELGNIAAPGNTNGDELVTADVIVALQLNLTVNDDGSLAPSFTYTNGLFSFNAGAKVDLAREQNFTERLIYSIVTIRNEITRAQNEHKINPYACIEPGIYPFLSGDLGLQQSAEMALQSNGLNLGTKSAGTDGAFGGYVQFVLIKNLNAVGPTYTLKHFKGPGNLAGLSEQNTDKLVFGFAARNPVDPYPAGRATALLDSIQFGQLSTQFAAVSNALK